MIDPSILVAFLAPATNPVEIELWRGAATMPAANTATTQSVEKWEDHTSPDGSRNRSVHASDRATLTVYLSSQPDANRPAVIICPGGGYTNLAIDKEGHNIAARFAARGVTAFVLKYRMPNGVAPAGDAMPIPVLDIRRAIQLVRERAGEWNIDPHNVGVMGFSAGGHLAGVAATEFVSPDDRPDFAMLIYPVISMHDELVHRGSRENLLGKSPGADLVARFSVEEHVMPNTPPMFLVHAKDDKAVPVANSERLAAAAKQAGVPCELIEYEHGGHGFGMGVDGGEVTTWFDRGMQWLHTRNITSKND